ncbi:ABC transporter substrate-binding protein [Bacillus sp. T3]|uniref:ABC transporter substrate-binding protein n=1 Tax=Bacillus sp. T3 TaxID=467262 RepID=UPI0029815BA8|nr:ABC transporter substrate-binding protein [Bacillus sp. T3]
MKKLKLKRSLSLLLIVLLAFVGGCSSKEENQQTSNKQTEKSENVFNQNWDQIVSEAKGSTVNFYMWGGDEGINAYIDEYIAPKLKKEYEIEVKRYPMDATEFINKLLSEKKANKATGEMDVLWVNGENFKTAKEKDLLLGAITEKLPNFKEYVDDDSPQVQYDFGFPTKGYEAPWGKVQFVFSYDSSKVASPPKSMDELEKWVKENPGKFTYPAPPDFTGSAFIRHVLNEKSENYSEYLKEYDESLMEKDANKMWDYLNKIEPYLWKEGKSYPQSLAQLDQLYKNGEVWMTMGYDEAGASNLIASGEFPKTTKTFVLEKGTLSNTHFLTVPFNSPNPSGALVLINYLLSPDAQLAKMDLKYWGENTSLSVERLPEKYKQKLTQIDRGSATLPEEELMKHRIPEIGADYVQLLERGWMDYVSKE